MDFLDPGAARGGRGPERAAPLEGACARGPSHPRMADGDGHRLREQEEVCKGPYWKDWTWDGQSPLLAVRAPVCVWGNVM